MPRKETAFTELEKYIHGILEEESTQNLRAVAHVCFSSLLFTVHLTYTKFAPLPGYGTLCRRKNKIYVGLRYGHRKLPYIEVGLFLKHEFFSGGD